MPERAQLSLFHNSSLRLTPGPARLRIIRMTAGSISLAGIVFGILAVGPFAAQHTEGFTPFTIVSFIVLIALPVVIGVWSGWGPLRALRGLAVIEAVALVVVMATWPFLNAETHDEATGLPWPLSISALPIVCLALVARGVFVWSYLGLIGALTVWVTYAASTGEGAWLLAFQTGLYAASFSSIFVGLVLVGLQSAERLDHLQAAERVIAARTAARLAREGERARFDGLIHDGVISTLLMAGRAEQLHGDHVRQAQDTLAQFARIASGASASGAVPVERLIGELRRVAAQHSLALSVEVDAATDVASTRVPADVVEAMVAAGGEALRNSMEHAAGRAGAGPTQRVAARVVERRVQIWVQEDLVSVGIHDDGVGFDPARVRPERLGVARSIVARMHELPGGYAVVDSQPGRGSAVTLGWVRR